MTEMRPEQIRHLLSKWEDLGTHRTDKGVISIGRVPHAGEFSYLHHLYPVSLPALQDARQSFPELERYDYNSFLEQVNGLILFSAALYLYGIRWGGTVIPWDIVDAAINYSEIGNRFDGLVIGGAMFGNIQHKYVQRGNGRVLAVSMQTNEVIFDWPDVDVLLRSEIKRLNDAFDQQDRQPSVDELSRYV